MTRRTLLAALGSVPLIAQSVPRPATDFEFTLTSGRKVKLAEYKGKVLAFSGILTT
jgi:hypothetical protein